MIVIEVKKKILKNTWRNLSKEIANKLRNELIGACPVDTGRLKNSILLDDIDNGTNISMAYYWKYVEYGTPPHIIKPKNKKALHWGGKNGPVVKLVHHPGTRPQPFIRTTLNTKLTSIISESLKKVLT